MPNNLKIRINALFNSVLNKAFLFMALTVLWPKLHFAQNKNQLGNFISVSAQLNRESNLSSTDSLLNSKYKSYRYNQFNLAYKHTLFERYSIADNNSKFTQVSIIPSLQWAQADFGKENFTRNFINLNLSLLGIFHTSNKNTFIGTLSALANEDEYTLPDANLRYTSAFLFARKVNKKFTYRLGVAFSYVFGDARIIPLLGAKWQITPKSILNFTLPLNINYKHSTKNPNLFYGFSSRNSGGFNSFQNKLNTDTINRVIAMRRRSFQFSADVKYIGRQYTVLAQVGVNLNQNVRFTGQNNNTIINNFEFTGSNTGFVRVNLIIPLGEVKKRKDKVQPDTETNPIHDELNDSWMDF
jgi:Domain of unknown function (DUF6268)